MEDMRHLLIDHLPETLGTQVIIQFTEQLQNTGRSGLLIHDDTTIGQSAMRPQHLALFIGWQKCKEPTITIEHQRMVAEPVGMIVHVVAEEEERAILRRSYEPIPFVSHRWCVSYDVEHYSVNRLNSS